MKTLTFSPRRSTMTKTRHLRRISPFSCSLATLGKLLLSVVFLGLWSTTLQAQEQGQGSLVVSVRPELDQQSEASVEVFPQGQTTPIATTRLGAPTQLPAGSYKVTLNTLNDTISRENILVKAGRTSTVLLGNVAGVRVNVLDKKGRDLGVGVEVYDPVSGQKLGSFLSGETILATPGTVDITVAIPPQSQRMRNIALQENNLLQMNFHEQVYGELRVRPMLNGADISASTTVIIAQANANKEVARSEPGREHRFSLSPGSYDILVINPTGQGKPMTQDRAELTGEGTVDKEVDLNAKNPLHTPEL
jgi:hypothetical protein